VAGELGLVCCVVVGCLGGVEADGLEGTRGRGGVGCRSGFGGGSGVGWGWCW
jgi:hypothetical protein